MKQRVWVYLGIIWILLWLDLWITIYFLEVGNGILTEANPIANWFMENLNGRFGLLVLKLLGMYALFLLFNMKKKNKWLDDFLGGLLIFGNAIPVIWNLYMIKVYL